jgi:hypothetical protein
MPCMLLYGDSGKGKTMILEKMERQHPDSYEERRGITLRPVVSVQIPPSPDERRFYTRMLEVLGRPRAHVGESRRCLRPRRQFSAAGTTIVLPPSRRTRCTRLVSESAAAVARGVPTSLVDNRPVLG